MYNKYPLYNIVTFVEGLQENGGFYRMRRIILFAAFIIAGLLSSHCHAYSGGTGTSADPYQIATKADLLALAATPSDYDKCFVLTADIDLEDETFTNSIIARNTVENSETYTGTAFTGIFDGDGHTINNFTIDTQIYSYIGVFGQINPGGYLKNMGILNCSFSGVCYVGTLAGANNGGVIMQCYSASTVQGTNGIGGLIGQNTGGITRCHSSGDTNGSCQVGGLVGCNIGVVGNCYSTCDVSGVPCGTLTQITGNEYTYGAGGLVGYNKGGLIQKSYSTGSVTGCYIGGLVGSGGYYGESIIWQCNWICDDQGNCWEDCIPIPTSDFIYSEDWVQDSFWDMGSSGCSFSAGGSPMSGNIDQFLSAGWDFATIWTICQGTNYPRLSWQIPAADFVCPEGVNSEDLDIIIVCWLETVRLRSDLNSDGFVNMADFTILAQAWLPDFPIPNCPDCDVNIDINGDHTVDVLDLIIMAQDWLLQENTACRIADLNADGRIDLADYAIFAGHWLEGI
jgi:hypothetical protein